MLEKQRSEKVRVLILDVFFMSINVITLEGEFVNIDGNGNRVAALCYGPKQVVIVAGMNKVVSDVGSAVKRIKTHACPANTIRLGRDTPCAETGKCSNCLQLGVTACSMTVVTRFCNLGRIHVILVNDNLGY